MQNERRQARRNTFLRCFWRDESGQGIVFAAVSMILLVGFVALVFNVGTAVENRMRIQMAADNAAYSGVMVQANALSTIGWINSAMAQIYYNCQRYAVDVNVTGAAAVAELRMSRGAPGEACDTHRRAYDRARTYIPQAKAWLVDLTRIENAIAILTPRLMEEEMFSVAKQAGAERLSLYPSNRMFPHEGSTLSYRIERFEKGWRITNLTGGSGEMLYIYLDGDEWHIEYSNDGVVRQEIVIRRESSTRWNIRYYEPPGRLVQEIYIVRTENLGWVIWGSERRGGGTRALPRIEFEPVDMDGDGYKEGTRVSYKDVRQVLRRGAEGDLYIWNFETKSYHNMTSSETNIAGVNVKVNVSNVIHFPGATARIGDPTVVTIGRATIVLRDPPTIRTGLGPVSIAVTGFDPDSFSISVGGFNLNHGDADGRWRKYFNRQEEIWWRHRLVEQRPEAAGALQQWQYDRQVIGAYMQYEAGDSFANRYVYGHVYGDRWDNPPPWVWPENAEGWFDPVQGLPVNWTFRSVLPNPADPAAPCDYDPPDGNGIRKLSQGKEPPEGTYYLTERCALCDGTGYITVKDAQGNPMKTLCPACLACDNDRNGVTDVRVFLRDLYDPNPSDPLHPEYLQRYICDGRIGLSESDYLDARIYRSGYGLPTPKPPLVLAEEFFQYGVNVGAWRDADAPMLFRYLGNVRKRVRDGVEVPGWSWGYVGISSARAGIPEIAGYLYQFDTPERREQWCAGALNNLYAAHIGARLYPCREQVKDYDLDRDILQGETIVRDDEGNPISYAIDESGTSYLWDAVLRTRGTYPYEGGNWLTEYDGRSDPRVNELLRNMRTRADGETIYGDIFYYPSRGARFDFGSSEIDELVLH